MTAITQKESENQARENICQPKLTLPTFLAAKGQGSFHVWLRPFHRRVLAPRRSVKTILRFVLQFVDVVVGVLAVVSVVP